MERRVEGGAEVQQDGRAQSVAANGRGATCADGRFICAWKWCSIQVVLTVPGPRDPGDGKIKKASAELQ